jgi:glucosylceramidase
MAHFSKYIRPEAKIIESENSNSDIMVTAAKNPDGTIAVVIFNETDNPTNINLLLKEKTMKFSIDARAIQTVLIPN